MSNTNNEPTVITEVRAKLTLTEIGVIISLITSASVGIFGFGVWYGQVQTNKSDIQELQEKVDPLVVQVSRIDANVTFLAELAKEERTGNRRGDKD